MIESDICPRCEESKESWDHIWVCERNERSVREVIEHAIVLFEEELESKKEEENLIILRDINIAFLINSLRTSQISY